MHSLPRFLGQCHRLPILFICSAMALLPMSACQLLNPSTSTIHAVAGGVSVSTTTNDGTLLIDIQSKSGIGAAKVQLNSASIDKITLRLHLKGLEQLTLSNEYTQLVASVSSVDRVSITQNIMQINSGNSQPQRSDETTITSTNPNWLTIRTPDEIQSAAGPFFEVDVPQQYWDQPERILSIEWIDFYR